MRTASSSCAKGGSSRTGPQERWRCGATGCSCRPRTSTSQGIVGDRPYGDPPRGQLRCVATCTGWTIRMWLPNGSRRPKSVPYDCSVGSCVISTPLDTSVS